MDLKLRCSSSGCPCTHFTTSKENLRVCDGCSHSWLAHLFEKLLRNDEVLSIFDVCSLALYGTHALPIRLKIVIERLLSTLQPEETDKILQSFGWAAADLARGYMIHDSEGCFLNKWSILPRDEEPLVLEQFLRFGPTHSLTFALLRKELSPPPPSLTPQSSSTFSLSPKTAAVAAATTIMTTPPAEGHQSLGQGMGLGLFMNNNNNNNVHHTNNLNHNHAVNANASLRRSPSNTNVRSPSKSTASENAGERDRDRDRDGGGSVLNLSTSGPSSAAESIGSVGSHSHSGDEDGDGDDDDEGIMVQDGEIVDENDNDDSNDEDQDDKDVDDKEGRRNGIDRPSRSRNREQDSATAVDLSSNSKSAESGSGSSPSPNSAEVVGLGLGLLSKMHESEMLTRSGLLNSMRSAGKMTRDHEKPHSGPGRKPKYGNSLSSKQAWATAAIAASVTVNPATGKRRVLCSVCQKTFCDKGALKIHFSAVHLREMHKCTVNGCTMMFSSRRSRNRHSANPNPKLHSPHIRRKISPNDGRSGGSSRNSLNNHVPLNAHQHGHGGHGHGHGHGHSTSLLPGTNLLAPRFSPPAFGGQILPPSFNLGGSSGVISSSSSMDGNDERAADDHHNPAILSAAVSEILRKNGARKRKLSNPIRVPNNLDFGSLGAAAAAAADMSKLMKDASSAEASQHILSSHVNQLLMMRSQMLGSSLGENRDRVSVSPKHRDRRDRDCDESPTESRGSSPGDLFANNPLALLASKVFQFNPQFQNLPFNPAMTEKLYESLFAGKRGMGMGMDLLMDKKSQSKLNNNNNLDDESGSVEHTAV